MLNLSYTLNWLVDPRPVGFHLVNLAVHAANALLVVAVCRRLVSARTAVLAGLLFALHPIQTEAVTYVSGRSVSLMTTAYLAALLAWMDGRRRLALLGFAVAMGVKETAITWPAAVVLVCAAAEPATGLRGALRRSWPAWAAAAAALALVAASPRYRGLLAFSLGLRAPLDNLPSQVVALGYLLSRLVLVHRLTIDPALPAPSAWTPALALGGLLAVAAAALGVAALGARAGRRRALPPGTAVAGFTLAWLVLHLLPTNSLVARADVVSERQLYLASLGPFLLLALGLDALWTRLPRRAAAVVPAAAGVLIGLLATATHLRNRDYHTEAALWAAAVRVTPTNARAFNNLGYGLQLAGCLPDARDAYAEALRLQPDYAKAQANVTALDATERAAGGAPRIACAAIP